MRYSVNSQALPEDAGAKNSRLMDIFSELWETKSRLRKKVSKNRLFDAQILAKL